MLDFRNQNTLYTSIISETLARLGITTAVICPGSRSTPLTIAFAQHSAIETIPILDERSAAFFALGIAKKTSIPVVLICTSGTAVANFFPAIIEATTSKIPLIILTADRPPELRDCHAGQTIDQVKIFGDYPRWYAELTTPSLVVSELAALRNTIINADRLARSPTPGVVHLNIPLREPLVTIADTATSRLKDTINPNIFFNNCQQFPIKSSYQLPREAPTSGYGEIIRQWQSQERGIIIAGLAAPEEGEEYCRSISRLAQALGFPVLGEGLSPLRNYATLNPYLISTYDFLLRSPNLAQELIPEVVIQIGELPTSKQLRQWLTKIPAPRWIIAPDHSNFDPLHGDSRHLVTSLESLIADLVIPTVSNSLNQAPQKSLDRSSSKSSGKSSGKSFRESSPKSSTKSLDKSSDKTLVNPIVNSHNYLKQWLSLEQTARQHLDRTFANLEELIEPKVAWLLSQTLPKHTPLFVANSMPIRDVEFFWKPGDRQIQTYFSRGANGIDGTLSTALGIAHHNQSSVLLTGDLALLHDTNGFLIRQKLQGHLTIILINNNGGGIFENLPIREFDPPFEEYFATPQSIDFAGFAHTYSLEYQLITAWQQLQILLETLPPNGIRLLEIPTDRRRDAQWRKTYLAEENREKAKSRSKERL